MRILVCDDHEVYRLGIRSVVDATDDIDVVAETTDPAHALRMSIQVAPDVAIVAHGTPDGLTAELVRRLSLAGVGTLVLSHSCDQDDLLEVLRAGARGYLTRGVAPEQLLDGIRAVARRETALDSRIAGQLVHYLDARPAATPTSSRAPALDSLTSRQRAVADLVAEGLSNAEIAERLYLSRATVKSHLTIILRRLGLRDRTQLAILVNRRPLDDDPDSIWQ